MRKRRINAWVLGLLGLAAAALGCYLWANAMIGSLLEYRSVLAGSAPTPGEAVGEPLTGRVVVVLMDALREDTALDPGIMPTLASLRAQGASARMTSRPPSLSAPGWTTLLTGAWPDINDAQQLNPEDVDHVRPFSQDNLFTAAERAGLRTAVSGYAWFEQMLSGSGVDAGFYTLGEDAAADRQVVEAALPWLEQDFQLILIHIDQIDHAGHYLGGPLQPEWAAAASRADGLLGEIATGLDLARDTLIVVSDHGQINPGGHGGSEALSLTEPFVMVGAAVRPGAYGPIAMIDVAPTVSTLLGLNIPATNQGHVLTEMLVLPEGETQGLQAALAAQQAALLSAYTTAIGESAAPSASSDPVDSSQAALEAARGGRLARERVWRNLLAICLAVLPGYLLVLRREKRTLWMLAGILVYLLVFHGRYALLGRHTYSLSSIPEQMAFITYTAENTALALVPGWLTAMLGLRAFRQGARQAAALTVGFLWLLLYILALPMALNFAVNGVVATWTLPDFLIQFLGFFSLVQVLFIACLGLVLAGVAAVIGRARNH